MTQRFEKKTTRQTGTKPVQVFRLRGVAVSIFENHTTSDGHDVTFYKTNVQKTYKDGEQFKHTTSLGRDDLPVARLLLQRAWEWILEAERSKHAEE